MSLAPQAAVLEQPHGEASSHRALVLEKARSLGFDAVGIARADEPLTDDFAHYERFVAEGFHGSMSWLAEQQQARRRLDTPAILEGARSVICLARRYARHDPEDTAPPFVAAYARGRDYHVWLRHRVKQLAAFVRQLQPGARARPMIDTAPVLERAWAARAGLGFVGKNGLLIVPGQGSLLLLGEVVTTLSLEPDAPMEQRCGSCSRCLDACPTRAFVAPFVLDPRKCIAYLTIEHDGPFEEPLRTAVGEQLFGCDVCQDVCPFNRCAPPPLSQTRSFAPLPLWGSFSIEAVLRRTDRSFAESSDSSPVRRLKEEQLLRNALIVAANGRLTACLDAIRLLLQHESAAVRTHAAWALEKLSSPPPDREPELARLGPSVLASETSELPSFCHDSGLTP